MFRGGGFGEKNAYGAGGRCVKIAPEGPAEKRAGASRKTGGKKNEWRLCFGECGAGDLHTLHALSCQTFSDAFAHLNTPENMKRYLKGAFHPDKLADELKNAQSHFCFLYAAGALAGYIKWQHRRGADGCFRSGRAGDRADLRKKSVSGTGGWEAR